MHVVDAAGSADTPQNPLAPPRFTTHLERNMELSTSFQYTKLTIRSTALLQYGVLLQQQLCGSTALYVPE